MIANRRHVGHTGTDDAADVLLAHIKADRQICLRAQTPTSESPLAYESARCLYYIPSKYNMNSPYHHEVWMK